MEPPFRHEVFQRVTVADRDTEPSAVMHHANVNVGQPVLGVGYFGAHVEAIWDHFGRGFLPGREGKNVRSRQLSYSKLLKMYMFASGASSMRSIYKHTLRVADFMT